MLATRKIALEPQSARLSRRHFLATMLSLPLIRTRTATSEEKTMQKPVPVIIDTDIGGDIDDTWAVMFALSRPELDVRLITTAFDDTERKTRLVAKMLERIGRTDIPIGRGPRKNENPLHQEHWLGDYTLDGYAGTVHTDGVGALIDTILGAPEPVTLLTLGPVVNIREALVRAPEIAEKAARLIAMAGGIRVPYLGQEKVTPEWNVLSDVPGFRMLLEAPWDVTLSPVDGCGDIILRGERYARVRDSQTRRARVVIENFKSWKMYNQIRDGESSVLFDTTVPCIAFDESYFTFETVPISVTDEGLTFIDPDGGTPTRCQTGWRDREGFEELLVTCLTDMALG
jgi:inosine-uridine nucleoside N-ribohydrolase